MNANLAALVVGTLLAVGALSFVLYPLFFAPRARRSRGDSPPVAQGIGDDSAIVALREIEFDRATGKLSEHDYAELRRAYGERALRELRATNAQAAAEVTADATTEDPIEARVRAYRATHRECSTCGLRPEPDAIYCSTCGSYLERACPACGERIVEPGAAFCSSCGKVLTPGREAALV